MSLSGVIGVSNESIEVAMNDYLSQNKGWMEFCDAATLEYPETGVITNDLPNTTIVYPGDFMEWDELSCFLSEKLNVPVFSFHIHDGDFWMYTLFKGGKEVDKFLPVPDYWEELDDEEKAEVKGDAERLASLVPNLSVDTVKKYLIEWDINCLGENKAYPDDEFAIGNCWQLCDFMKKAGLENPIDDRDHTISKMFKFIFQKNDNAKKYYIQNSKTLSKKPWWKFW